MSPPPPFTHKIPVGISSCLAGENVRYDGGNRHAPLIVEQLADVFEFHTICPEMGIGMGVPRNPIQLVKTADSICARGVDDASIDVTKKLEKFSLDCLEELPTLYGYIFKARSPSCGIKDVNIFNETGKLLDSNGTGIHAMAIMKIREGMPVTSEAQLQDTQSIEKYKQDVINYYHSGKN